MYDADMALDDKRLTYAKVDLAAAATLTITVPDGQFLKLVHMYTTMTADGTVKFVSGSTDLTGDMTFKGGAGPCFRSSVDDPFLVTLVEDEDFKITPTTGGLDGWIAYYIEGTRS